jgi:hypothetical protein
MGLHLRISAHQYDTTRKFNHEKTVIISMG